MIAGGYITGAINFEEFLHALEPREICAVVVGLIVILFFTMYKFYRKRLEHKEIMAAIDKGYTLRGAFGEKSPKSILSIYQAVFLMLFSIPFFFLFGAQLEQEGKVDIKCLLAASFLGAGGISLFVRGVLLRKSRIKAIAMEKGVPFEDVYLLKTRALRGVTCIAFGLPLTGISGFFFATVVVTVLNGAGATPKEVLICTIPLIVGIALLLRGIMVRIIVKRQLRQQ